jgi:hypothetical protein
MIALGRIRARKHQRAARAEQLSKLGFIMLDPSEPELKERVLRLYPWASRPRPVERVWMRDEPGCRFFVVDWVSSGVGAPDQSSDTLVEGDVLVVSPSLHLPRFRMRPRIEGSGLLMALLRRWRQYEEKRLGGPVRLDDISTEFARNYSVTGEDATALRQLLTTSQFHEIGRLKHRTLEAKGDMFSYWRYKPDARDYPMQKLVDVVTLLNEARTLYGLFQGGNP